MKKMNFKILTLLLLITSTLSSQTKDSYVTLYNSGNFDQSLKQIETKLKDIYDQRVEDKRIPNKQLYIETIGEDKLKDDYQEIIKNYRKRKIKKHFIENNSQLANLHLYAGLIYRKKNNHQYALHHLYQTLRYKELEYEKDDIVFYEISQVLKEQNYFKGYIDSLEMAYSLNSDKIEYSRELGESLYITGERRRAIFHLQRYIEKADKVEQRIYIKLASLNEGEKHYLKTQKYYLEYLMKDQNNAYVHFAVGVIALNHTGDLKLAKISFEKTIKLSPETDIYRKAKSYEFIGEIHYRYMKYNKSLMSYEKAIQYQNKTDQSIRLKEGEIKAINDKINILKASLILEQNPDKHSEHLKLRVNKGERIVELKDIKLQYKKLNVGKTKWRVAFCYEQTEKYEDAIKYYKEAVLHYYKTDDSERRIKKLKLKLFRGY